MNDTLVLWVVLGACVCGAVIAVGVLEYAVWLMEQEQRGKG
jgi:hypothetical protein